MEEKKPLVSVIIPVFNVELYLRQCLDSVIHQTYRNLEILIIDDGSTDESGKICEDYRKDERVRIFHTENRGLSCARNLGLENVNGNYISFLDSDDWFEEDAITRVMEVVKATEADIVCFGHTREYASKSKARKHVQIPRKHMLITGEKILRDYCLGNHIDNAIWDKIYKSQVFLGVRFPEGRNYEDVATTYKLILKADKVACISERYIHYRARKNSISQCQNLRIIRDQWLAVNESYEGLLSVSQEYGYLLLGKCIACIGRMWRWYSSFTKEEQKAAQPLLNEMQSFADVHREEVLKSLNISVHNKILCICTVTTHPILMKSLYLMNTFYKRLLCKENYFA